ncbi:MAG: NYN domain-containing protein [Methanomethylovorans sp.]|uniref:NYN domain-containing protein n=1 Tax=Methanomethylovorans sp. TaxID=2758717 RepID=UPI00261B958F|nr:NYN domain-containing protein [Methanomethylovorans sp.]
MAEFEYRSKDGVMRDLRDYVRTNEKLAVLIDADNAQPSIIEGLMDEIAIYGIAIVKRIYGDWTKPNLNSWKKILLDHSMQPIQQFAYTDGKNATDSALIIDAMDLLHTERFDGFCIISSDSDFTRLAQRIRESGVKVYGFGEKKTPSAFASACDKFIYTENLRGEEAKVIEVSTPSLTDIKDSNKLKGDSKLVNLLRAAVEDSANEDGWASLAEVGDKIIKRSSTFDPRSYGYKKLGDLVVAIDLFEIDRKKQQDLDKSVIIYIKDKKNKKSVF